ncbi:hypothetical protein J2S19_001084 [Metabacillus malikii]|uniref:Uncharacterized protein n=1 Tax=Metabacillus malikii TaxID=1504265 RepID=A0ABT9ZC63_9BACI|nr:hypothetical protein [Metabacillus malikii]
MSVFFGSFIVEYVDDGYFAAADFVADWDGESNEG